MIASAPVSMVFHHVGVVTPDVDGSAEFYRALGYAISDRFDDPLQQVTIRLCTRDDGPMIELIEPASAASPAAGWLKRVRVGPYHTCYGVTSLEAAGELLEQLGLAALGSPVPAVAFGGLRVVFYFGALTGLVELVENNA